MKAGVFRGPGDIRVEEVPEPKIQNSKEAIIKITYTCICGSDLWSYRGITKREIGSRTGHEFLGRVLEVGDEVKKVKTGDLVVGPFWWCDGTCPECQVGMTTVCRNGGSWGRNGLDGCQGEKMRIPFADANLFSVPNEKMKEELMPSLLALSDVMGTGYHAALYAGVSEGKTVAVVGDGAVGLCAVLACKRLKAKTIILLSRHEDRATIGHKFGATEIVTERGEEGVKKVKELTGTLGVDCALECVGTEESWHEVLSMVRAGGKVGFVGLPGTSPVIKIEEIFGRNITIGGGRAPTADYIPQLMPEVLEGKLDCSDIFDITLSLDDLAKGYEMMDKREAIKVLIKP